MSEETKKKRLPMRKIKAHLLVHVRAGERGISNLKRSSTALDEALKLGLRVGEEVKLPDNRVFVLVDQFAEQNTTFSAKKFDRYKFKEVKPLPVRPAKKGGES